MSESGHRVCAEEYALKVGRTVEELRADKITAVKCRCRPFDNAPHCGGFYVTQETIETVDTGDGREHQVVSWKRLTALHGEPIEIEPHFPSSVLREAIAEFEAST